MNPDPENFDQLRRLLALKRHEQPPPGYFAGFSVQVMARIQAGETGAEPSWLGRMQWHLPWLDNLWEMFEAKPIAAGAFGLAVCGLLVGGILCSDGGANGSLAVLSTAGQPGLLPLAAQPGQSAFEPVAAVPVYAPEAVSEAAAPVPKRSLFQDLGRPQLINYRVPASR